MQRLFFWVLSFIVVGSLSGCQCTPDALVSPDEIKKLEGNLNQLAQLNQSAQCPRPVLRGEAKAGSGREAVRKLWTLESVDPGCRRVLIDFDNQYLGVAQYAEGEVLTPTGSSDSLPDVRKLTSPSPDAVTRLLDACGATLPAVLEDTSAFEESCSPYMWGQSPLLRGSSLGSTAPRFLRLRTPVLASQGKLTQAIREALDLIRVGQDASRGSSLVIAMLNTSAIHTVLPQLALHLQHDLGPLDPAQLEALLAELGRLLDHHPRLDLILRDELAQILGQGILPTLDRSWTPPGGFEPGPNPRSWEPTHAIPDLEVADVLALEALGTQETLAAFIEACPEDASLRTCLSSIDERARNLCKSAEAQNASDPAVGARLSGSEDERSSLKRALILKNACSQAPLFRRFGPDYARGLSELAAFRLLLAVRLHHERENVCPDLAVLKGDAFASLLEVPGLGGRLELREVSGALLVHSPAWVDAEVPDAGPLFALRCPPPRQPPPPVELPPPVEPPTGEEPASPEGAAAPVVEKPAPVEAPPKSVVPEPAEEIMPREDAAPKPSSPPDK